jgi:predicted DNA-binding WGR domain protein
MANIVDRAVAKYNGHLAEHGAIVDALDARLVLIDAGENMDKYYVLQALEDQELEGDDRFFSFQHWGRTGTAGDGKLEGPSSLFDVKARLAKVFKDKTGAEWGSIQPGDRVAPGKYWLQQAAKPDVKAKWEYYVGDGVDGKRVGWYPYTEDASDGVESLYAQHEANSRESRTSSRVVESGYFSYKVDLEAMTQTNTRTSKCREIRRVLGEAEGSQPATAQDVRMSTKSLVAPMRMKAMKRRAGSRPPLMKAKGMNRANKSTKSTPAKKTAMKKKLMKTKPIKKVNRASKIAKGKHAKVKVWRGTKAKTTKGLKKGDLMKSKDGKIVSKKKSAQGRQQFGQTLAKWVGACKQARKELGITGFMAIKKGTPFYNKAKELYPTAQPHVLFAHSFFLLPEA